MGIVSGMAQKTILVDDITGEEEDVETIEFALDSTQYTIDLGPDNAEALREALSPYIEHAQRIGGPARATRRRRSAAPVEEAPARSGKEDLNAIRIWARENGHTVSDRGRISSSIKEAYAASQN
jgi:hypothetical protein